MLVCMEKVKHGTYNPITRRYFNELTGNWVLNLRPSLRGQGILIQRINQHDEYLYAFNSFSIDQLFPNKDTAAKEKILLFLTHLRGRYNCSFDKVFTDYDTGELFSGYHYFTIEVIRLYLSKDWKSIAEKLKSNGIIDYEKINGDLPFKELYIFQLSSRVFNGGYKRNPITTQKALKARLLYQSKYRLLKLSSLHRKLAEISLNTIILMEGDNNQEELEQIRMYNQDLFNRSFSCDEFTKRFNCIEARQKKRYRTQYRDKREPGNPTKGLDVKNSQAFMSALCITSPELLRIVLPEIIHQLGFLESLKETRSFKEYVQDCMDGVVYDKYAKRLFEACPKYRELLFIAPLKDEILKLNELHFGKESKSQKIEQLNQKIKKYTVMTDRDLAKILFFRSLYSSQYNKGFFIDVLKTMYPEVVSTYELIKSFDWSGINPSRTKNGKPKMFSNVSFLMCRVESFLMDLVREKVVKEFDWCVCIHDQIIVKEKDFERLRGMFIEVFSSLNLPIPSFN
jgi:hypothetical protein